MFHRSNLGSFGEGLQADMQGYVPEADDGPWDFTIDYGSERTHDADGELTEYGQWWEEEGYPEWQAAAIAATERATAALAEWQGQSV
jgi:hypothetical protein